MWHPVEVKASCLDIVAKAGIYVILGALMNTSALPRQCSYAGDSTVGVELTLH